MFKKVLFAAAAIVVASTPALVSAQEFFFSFDEFSRVSNQTVANGTTSGTAYIFADAGLQFSQLDADITISGPAAITAGGIQTFNDGGSDGNKFSSVLVVDQNDQNAPPQPNDARLAVITINAPPFIINDGQLPTDLDADFRAGANGFLLASVDFDLSAGTAGGTANFDFTLGGLGAADGNDVAFVPTFGNGQVTVEAAVIPEPSSAVLLILGAAGMVARRRRS